MRRFLFGALSGGVAVVAIALVVIVTIQAPERIDFRGDGIGCTGWQRVGAMTERENNWFKELGAACKSLDVEASNKLLFIKEELVAIECHPSMKLVNEPSVPSVELRITNIANSSIFLLDHNWSSTLGWVRGQTDLQIELQPDVDSNIATELEPGEAITFKHFLKLPDYGKYQLNVLFGSWKYESLTPQSSRSRRAWEVTRSCNVEWQAEE